MNDGSFALDLDEATSEPIGQPVEQPAETKDVRPAEAEENDSVEELKEQEIVKELSKL